ncbi:hypothetical protein UY3_04525 [Chelonia mydas]|uniref:Uncharacterized protein n=1 Tax=Chelonia mydas TaxID=8469 RepID=M7BKD2_CHEMY|nr:hypothetical protein UY3_04525 [Chelonia mydas]
MKLKELWYAYQKTREANGHSGSEPHTCRFYDELHFGDEEDEEEEEEEVEDSAQQASKETIFIENQELFLSWDLEPVYPKPTQSRVPDPSGGEGTSDTPTDLTEAGQEHPGDDEDGYQS